MENFMDNIMVEEAPDSMDLDALLGLTDDVDSLAEKVKDAGYELIVEPNDKVIKSVPEYPIRMAFCIGPLGEQIEFFYER